MAQVTPKNAPTPIEPELSGPSATSQSPTGFANNDNYAAGPTPGGDASADPYAHVNWNDPALYANVDWSQVNFDSDFQSQLPLSGTSSDATSPRFSDAQPEPIADPHADTTGGTGPGVYLTNSSNEPQTYSFYNNAANGNGWANPTYTDPVETVTLQPGESKFVSLPAEFKGRVQKTNGDASENTWGAASTWAEFQLSASNDGAAHGDISYQAGYDGAATIGSTDGSNQVGGTTEDLLADAPTDILAQNAAGNRAIANNTNAAATAYLQSKVDESKAYTGTAGSGTNDVASKNNQLAITFY